MATEINLSLARPGREPSYTTPSKTCKGSAREWQVRGDAFEIHFAPIRPEEDDIPAPGAPNVYSRCPHEAQPAAAAVPLEVDQEAPAVVTIMDGRYLGIEVDDALETSEQTEI